VCYPLQALWLSATCISTPSPRNLSPFCLLVIALIRGPYFGRNPSIFKQPLTSNPFIAIAVQTHYTITKRQNGLSPAQKQSLRVKAVKNRHGPVQTREQVATGTTDDPHEDYPYLRLPSPERMNHLLSEDIDRTGFDDLDLHTPHLTCYDPFSNDVLSQMSTCDPLFADSWLRGTISQRLG